VETQNGSNERPVELAKIFATLPLTTYRAGEKIITDGSASGRLFVLKSGEVSILKHSTEIARVNEPGAVFGELSALLSQPHSADVIAAKESQFHVADAALLDKERIVLFHIARILAQRIVVANKNIVELRNQLGASQPPSVINGMLKKIEGILSTGGASYES
jgi:CRP/FNR family transcriptional regulator, cyclic AMP receptor protein